MNAIADDADARRRDLATIHIAAKELGMDRSTYESMLFIVGRVRSSADLDWTGRKRVIEHLRSRGFKAKPAKKPRADRPKNMSDPNRGPSLRKIEALLLDAGRSWAYVSRGTNGRPSMVKRICGVDRIEFADVDGLHRLIGALMIDQKRRAAKEE